MLADCKHIGLIRTQADLPILRRILAARGAFSEDFPVRFRCAFFIITNLSSLPHPVIIIIMFSSIGYAWQRSMQSRVSICPPRIDDDDADYRLCIIHLPSNGNFQHIRIEINIRFISFAEFSLLFFGFCVRVHKMRMRFFRSSVRPDVFLCEPKRLHWAQSPITGTLDALRADIRRSRRS